VPLDLMWKLEVIKLRKCMLSFIKSNMSDSIVIYNSKIFWPKEKSNWQIPRKETIPRKKKSNKNTQNNPTLKYRHMIEKSLLNEIKMKSNAITINKGDN